MKTLVVIAAFGKKKNCSLEKIFDGKSSFDLCLDWAEKCDFEKQIVIFSDDDFEVAEPVEIARESPSKWTSAFLCEKIAFCCEKYKCDDAVLTFADRPFNNVLLTKELLDLHTTYKAEYTFADGYVSGISPVIVNGGAAKIIAALGNDIQKSSGSRLVSDILDVEGSNLCPIFSIMQGDINSFEIETAIAKKDYRLLRVDLSVSKKINRIACVNLWQAFKECHFEMFNDLSPEDFCDKIEKNANVLRTVPAFYNLQLASETEKMSLENAKSLFKKISDFSGEAVIGLSAYFDVTGISPFDNEDFIEIVKEALSYEDFKLFIETDEITEETAEKISNIALKCSETVKDRIFFAVEIAPTSKFLNEKGGDESKSRLAESFFSAENQAEYVKKISMLKKHFPKTYPQLTRTQYTESHLENFFRYWSNKENESEGNIIIQKYNNYCGKIKALKKTADLSPLDRNPCWHLRRDLTILCDGRLPVCMQQGYPFENAAEMPNVFTSDLAEIWKKMQVETEKHINENYCEFCKDCDEYYTFNF